MGTWGTALFSDDTASDVREDFRTRIGDGVDPNTATDQLVKDWQPDIGDPDEAAVFWLALAATQWQLGRLLPHVRDRALQILDTGQDLGRWRDSRHLKQREEVLAKLRSKLLSTPPKAKRVAPRFRSINDWPVGSLHAYELRSGEFCVFRVIGHHTDKGGTAPVVEMLDWVGQELPSAEALTNLPIRTRTYPTGHYVSQFMIGSSSKRDVPGNRIRSLTAVSRPSQEVGRFSVFLWRLLDSQLEQIFGIGRNVA